MPLKLRYLQFCRNSLCLRICLLSFIVFYLLPLTEAILSGLQGSFSFPFHHISFIVVIIIIFIYIYIHALTSTYICVVFTSSISLFSLLFFDYSKTWLSLYHQNFLVQEERLFGFQQTSCFFWDIQVVFVHTYVRKIRLLLVENVACSLWICACMMN